MIAVKDTGNDTQPDQGRCWCCDRPYPPEEMVYLGAHPEVTVCRDCARYLNRRAAMLPGRPTPLRVVRRATQAVRDRVMARNLHESRILGPLLRWLDKHLPLGHVSADSCATRWMFQRYQDVFAGWLTPNVLSRSSGGFAVDHRALHLELIASMICSQF